MNLVLKRIDTNQYFTGEDERGLLHWSSAKSLSYIFKLSITKRNLSTLNNFLNEFNTNSWEFNWISKKEYIDKMKTKFDINEVTLILRCHLDKIKVKVEES